MYIVGMGLRLGKPKNKSLLDNFALKDFYHNSDHIETYLKQKRFFRIRDIKNNKKEINLLHNRIKIYNEIKLEEFKYTEIKNWGTKSKYVVITFSDDKSIRFNFKSNKKALKFCVSMSNICWLLKYRNDSFDKIE